MYYSKQKQLQPRVNYQGRDPIGLKKRKVSKMSSKLFHNGPPRKDKPKKCESSLCCKATAKLEEEVDSWDNWLKTEAPDLYEDFEDDELLKKRDDAFEWFCKLASTGMDKEMALSMLRSQFPTIAAPEPEVVEEQPKPAEPEPVPESVSLMNMGTGQASATTPSDPRTFDDILDAMRRAAQNSL